MNQSGFEAVRVDSLLQTGWYTSLAGSCVPPACRVLARALTMARQRPGGDVSAVGADANAAGISRRPRAGGGSDLFTAGSPWRVRFGEEVGARTANASRNLTSRGRGAWRSFGFLAWGAHCPEGARDGDRGTEYGMKEAAGRSMGERKDSRACAR